jgi:large subunit ribosomal protein L30e
MISKEILRTITTGKVLFGYKIAIKKIDTIKAFIISSDCPHKNEIIKLANKKPVHIFNGNNIELGLACGKPFGISVLAILNEGKSNILNLIKE